MSIPVLEKVPGLWSDGLHIKSGENVRPFGADHRKLLKPSTAQWRCLCQLYEAYRTGSAAYDMVICVIRASLVAMVGTFIRLQYALATSFEPFGKAMSRP